MPFLQVRIWLETRALDRQLTEPAIMSGLGRPPGLGAPNKSGAIATGMAGSPPNHATQHNDQTTHQAHLDNR